MNVALIGRFAISPPHVRGHDMLRALFCKVYNRGMERDRAELLEMLEWAMQAGGLRYAARTSMNGAHCDKIDKARAAIAKAKGE